MLVEFDSSDKNLVPAIIDSLTKSGSSRVLTQVARHPELISAIPDPVERIATGSKCSAAYTTTGNLYVWGNVCPQYDLKNPFLPNQIAVLSGNKAESLKNYVMDKLAVEANCGIAATLRDGDLIEEYDNRSQQIKRRQNGLNAQIRLGRKFGSSFVVVIRAILVS